MPVKQLLKPKQRRFIFKGENTRYTRKENTRYSTVATDEEQKLFNSLPEKARIFIFGR